MKFGTQQPPNPTNILGTTVSGFDVFSRVIWGGSQTALLVILAAIACSIFIGIALGLVAGYFGGAGSTARSSSSPTRSTPSRRCCSRS